MKLLQLLLQVIVNGIPSTKEMVRGAREGGRERQKLREVLLPRGAREVTASRSDGTRLPTATLASPHRA